MPALADALHTYLLLDRSPHTNHQYTLVLTKLVTAIGPARSVERVTYEDLVDYLALVRSTGIKPITVSNYTGIIKAFFRWCVERRYIEVSPAADIRRKPLKRDSNRTRAVPPDELARMVECARHSSPRNYAIMLFLCDTGCRAGGLCSLKIANIDFDAMTALIIEKGQQELVAPFGEQTAAALRKWLSLRPAADHDYVWTGKGPKYRPLKPPAITALIHMLSEKAEVSRKWYPHAIRHSVGHAMAKAGLPVTVTQRRLGHRSAKITIDHYYPDDAAYITQAIRDNALIALQPPRPAGLRLVEPDNNRVNSKTAAG